MIPTSYYIALSAALFTTGVIGVLIRRNPIVMFMSIELMLNAANLAFAAFGRDLVSIDGQIIALMVIAVAAAEVVIGLAIIVTIFRSRQTVDVDEINTLKG